MLQSVSAADGAVQTLRPATGVAIDPRGGALLVSVNEGAGTRLHWRNLSDGSERELKLPAGHRLTPWSLAPNAVARDGRIALRVAIQTSWFWPAGILDPATGALTLLPDAASLDMLGPGWDAESRVVTVAQPTRSGLWRFRPGAPK